MAGDYFALFGLPRGVEIDQAELTRKYLAEQRKYHPDKLVNTAEAGAIQKSAELNEAYATLKNRMKRLQHLVELSGAGKLEARQDLLMEIMELREEHEENPGAVTEKIRHEIDELFANAALDFKSGRVDDMAQKFIKIKYLNNVIANT